MNFAGNSWLSKKCCCIMQRSIAKLSTTCPGCFAHTTYPPTFRGQEGVPTFCSAKNLVALPAGNAESGLALYPFRHGRVPSKAIICSSLQRGDIHFTWDSHLHQTVARRLSRGTPPLRVSSGQNQILLLSRLWTLEQSLRDARPDP